MKNKATDSEKGISSLKILNDLMGEIHGARISGILGIKKPEIYQTKHTKYIIRNSITIIILALSKFYDLWTHQLKKSVLKGDIPNEGTELINDIKKRDFLKFRNLVVAHYSDNKKNIKTPMKCIEEMLEKQNFISDEDFLIWTKEILEKIEIVKNCISA